MTILWPLLVLMVFQADDSEIIVQERFRVDFVRIDLLVLNRDGSPMTELKAEDFIVKENGKKVTLEFFEPQDYREAFASSTSTKATRSPSSAVTREKTDIKTEDPPRPQFIFATDLESLPLVKMRKSFRQLRDALAEGTFPKDADYLLYSMESGVLTDGFVPGVETLVGILNLFEDRMIKRYRGEINNRSSTNQQRVRGAGRASTGPRDLQGLENHIDSCLLVLKGRPAPEDVRAAQECVSAAVETFIEQESLAVQRVIGELEALTYRFQDRVGLKTLFFISPGFSLQPGREAGALAEFMVGQVTNALDSVPFSSFHGTKSIEDEFRRVTHACIRNRVVFHTLDIFGTADEQRNVRGRYVSGKNPKTRAFHRDYLSSYTAGLSTLATESGGFHLRAPNLNNSLMKVIPKLKYSYLLGYASPQGKPGKYRKIKIKCKRKGVKLHYRRGYFGAN